MSYMYHGVRVHHIISSLVTETYLIVCITSTSTNNSWGMEWTVDVGHINIQTLFIEFGGCLLWHNPEENSQ